MIKAKPLAWRDNSGEGFSLYQAQTPIGSFTYGTDLDGVIYAYAPNGIWDSLGSEYEARKIAEDAWARLALIKAREYVVIPDAARPTPEGEGR